MTTQKQLAAMMEILQTQLQVNSVNQGLGLGPNNWKVSTCGYFYPDYKPDSGKNENSSVRTVGRDVYWTDVDAFLDSVGNQTCRASSSKLDFMRRISFLPTLHGSFLIYDHLSM